MYYESIKLRGFKRMYLTGISEFHLRMPTAVTLILGTNGSGKSCLLNELSPLPGSKDAFEKDGLKEIVLEHHGKRYRLTTSFSNGTKCSFKEILSEDEEVELNIGGTQAVQKVLAEEHFGYTDTIHGLINNKVNFTDMGPLKRREWFTMMSNVSYDYVISLYMRLKEKQRDLQGYIKEEKQKLLQLEMVKSDEEVTKKLLKDTDELNQLINSLTGLIHSNQAVDLYLLQEQYKTLAKRLSDTVQSYLRCNAQLAKVGSFPELLGDLEVPLPFYYMETVQLEKIEHGLRNRLESNRKHIYHLGEQAARYERDLKVLADAQLDNLNDIDKQIRDLQARSEETQSKLHMALDIEQPTEALALLRQMLPTLIEIWNNIPTNDGRYTKVEYERLRVRLFEIEERLRRIQFEEEKLAAITRTLEGKRIECPSCKTSFIPGSGGEERHQHTNAHKGLQNEREALLKEQEVLTPQFTLQQAYLDAMRAYSALRLNETPLKAFHQYLIAHSILSTNPNEAINLAEQYQSELQLKESILSYQAQIEKLNTLRQSLMKDTGSQLSAGMMKEELEKIGQQLNDLHQSQGNVDALLIKVNKALQILKVRDGITQDLQRLIKTVDKERKALTESLLDEGIRQELNKLRLQQSTLLNEYTKLQYREQNIKDLKASIEKAEQKEKAYGLLVDELSPNKGLIAEGLFGFIQHFLKDMNAVIARIWSYPLVINIAEEMDEKGLTYRFPLLTGVNETEIPDVKDGSAGIKEIVNLAFKIVSMKYLKISDYPLVLDEFGRTFDATHRQTAGKAIHTLISTKEHQQLFMVSHYADSYGSLANINICVIDDSNIILPMNDYNQHTTITYRNGQSNKTSIEKEAA